MKAMVIYHPHFHPIPENDERWGTRVIEWLNIAEAKQHPRMQLAIITKLLTLVRLKRES